MSDVAIRPVPLGEIRADDDLGELLARAGEPRNGEVIVVSQKVVSKAEGRVVDLGDVTPGARALTLASELGKDPRLVELILAESTAVIRAQDGVLIVETRTGLICANAGIDSSNVPGVDRVALLPADPDRSARALRARIAGVANARPAVIVADSFGRPWRLGQTDVAIGCAGLAPLDDWRGRADRDGRDLAATAIAVADEVAAAAALARDKGSGEPAAVVSGLERFVTLDDGPGAAALRRDPSEDLFR